MEDRCANAHGYIWHVKQYPIRDRLVAVHFASGNGGNTINIVPAYDAVIAVSSSAYGQRYGQRRSEETLLRVLELLAA
jgi:hypothetical protein